MIKAIAFDLGGVLFAEGKAMLVNRLAQDHIYDPNIVLKVLQSKESMDLRKGVISDEEFRSRVQQQLPQGYDVQFIKEEWYASYVLDEEIKALIEKLQGRYTLIAFSGNIESRIQYLENKYHFRKLFDVEVYSYDYHLNKPDQEFVAAMIKASGVKPEEIVYIDDKEKDSDVAKEFGVNVVIYARGEVSKLINELQKFNITL